MRRWRPADPRCTWARCVIGLLGVACIGLAACSDDVREPVPAPSLTWSEGMPRGELNTDPWVEAVREAETAVAMAVNTNDFARVDLNVLWSEHYVNLFQAQAKGRLISQRAVVYLGPRAFEPLAVVVAEDGRSAAVGGCVAPYMFAEQSPTGIPKADFPAVVYELETDGGGQRRVVGVGWSSEPFTLPSGELLTDETCRGVEVPIALFEPAPDVDALVAMGVEGLVRAPSPTATAR